MGCARVNIDTVTKFLEKNLEFLVKYIPLANAHMSAFLTDQYWETFLTDDIKTELLSFTDEQLKHLAELGRNEDSILKTPHSGTGKDEITKPLLDEDKLEGNIGMRGSRGGTGGPDPSLKNHKNIGFLANTGPDPIKITKLPSQNSMLGCHRHASKTSF